MAADHRPPLSGAPLTRHQPDWLTAWNCYWPPDVEPLTLSHALGLVRLLHPAEVQSPACFPANTSRDIENAFFQVPAVQEKIRSAASRACALLPADVFNRLGVTNADLRQHGATSLLVYLRQHARAFDEQQDADHFGGLLWTVCFHAIRDWLWKLALKSIRLQEGDPNNVSGAEASGPSEQQFHDVEARAFQLVAERFSGAQQAVLFDYLLGVDRAETAARVNILPNTVSKLRRRGLGKLEEMLRAEITKGPDDR